MATTGGGGVASKAKRFGKPPAYLDGRPHFLDASYQQVLRFGRRPGGPSDRQQRSASVEDEITLDGDGEGQTNGTGQGDTDADVEQAEAGPSSARSSLPRTRSFDDDDEADEGDGDGEGGKPHPSTDSEWEYEDLPPELVIFDLGPEAAKLLQSKRQWASTGLETGTPFLKVGNVVFKGAWEESLTTCVVLKDELDRTRPFPNQHHPSPLPQPLPSTTHNRIKFRPAVNLDVGESAAAQRSRKVRSKLLASRRTRQGGTAAPATSGVRNSRSASAEGAEAEPATGDIDIDIDGEGEGDVETNPLTTRTSPAKTRKPGRPPLSLAQRTQRAVQRSLRPDVEPRVTQRIAKRMKMQEKLMEQLRGGAGAGVGEGAAASASGSVAASGSGTGTDGGGSTRVVLLGEGGSEYLDLQTGEVKRLRGRGRPRGAKNKPRVEQGAAQPEGEDQEEARGDEQDREGAGDVQVEQADQEQGDTFGEAGGQEEPAEQEGGQEEAGSNTGKGKDKAP